VTARTLKILLAISVALNLFAATAFVTVAVTRPKVEERVEQQRRPGGRPPAWEVVQSVDPAVQQTVRTAMRASALAARPDFEEARTLRRQAVQAVAAPDYDAAAVRSLLERSRTAELRGRARLEDDSLALFETLTPADRAALAPILSRNGPRGRGGGRGEGQGTRSMSPVHQER
jgi:uncharacterized membrane protein